MNMKTTFEILDPLVRYCCDNNIPRPVCEMDMVRGGKNWACCRSGYVTGIGICDTYEDALSEAVQNFVANFPYPYKK